MATLEVHDGRGRVEFLAIGREHPTLFGTDPKCDIVLSDPEVRPFHGRIRWRRGQYKVEAFPDVPPLEVSGKKVLATSLVQGDEIRVGGCRIFLMSPAEGPTDVEKTRARPFVPYCAKSGPQAVSGRPSAAQSDWPFLTSCSAWSCWTPIV